MTKLATTIEQQLQILKSRGLTILDEAKAREILLDIGYYRLGFYLFPFEKSFPNLNNRTHEYVDGATFEDAVNLYYFDFDMRLMLMRYFNRIEIAFRTSMIYNLSNRYHNNPIWFVSPSVLSREFVTSFEVTIYDSDIKRIPVISRHHRANPNDRFAPAWKTMEFMTFGAILKMFDELKEQDAKQQIANSFGIRQVVTFQNYMQTIRIVRNTCAHGLLLYDSKLTRAIRRGPAGNLTNERNNIIGALRVIEYIMKQISPNRASDMRKDIHNLYNELCKKSPKLKSLIPDFSSI